MERIARKTAQLSLQGDRKLKPELVEQMAVVMLRLADLFNRGGFDQVLNDINNKVPEEKRKDVTESYFKVLHTILGTVYLEVLQSEGVDIANNITPTQEQYYDDLVNTMGVLANYDAPFYVQIKSFEHKQASGFQITKSPGKDLVYLGCIFLVIGIVLMFYVAHKRIWIRIHPTEDGQANQLLVAGSGDRHQKEFAKEFEGLSELLDREFGRVKRS